MLGIDPDEQRRMMEESFDVIMALFRGEVVTAKTDWFTINEGRLQLRPYSNFDVAVAASISPSGPKAAGRHGVGLLSIAATTPLGFEMLAGHWAVMEEQAADHGTIVDRAQVADDGPDPPRRDRGGGASTTAATGWSGCSTTSPTSCPPGRWRPPTTRAGSRR